MSETPVILERYEPALPLSLIDASATNPRTHFNPAYIDELAASIQEKGLIQPIVVRQKPRSDRFEIVAGECRWRATKRTQRERIPALVRAYTDEQVLEIQLIENIHRTDLTPMEQARGYRRLIDSNPDKHSAATIAMRIGMSVDWVWDRLKLNDLIPEVVQLLETDRIAVGHAIVIARQKPADQKRIIGINEFSYGGPALSGLWQDEHAEFDFDETKDATKADPYRGYKPKTVRELERWIDAHIRFDVAHAAQAQPLQFEDVAARVEAAEERPGRGKKVIPITLEYRVTDDAKDPDERTYGEQSWRRADGTDKAKTCDHAVLGLVVAGPSRGQAFDVCIARDKCRVHFGKEIREREKAAKARAAGDERTAAKADAKANARAEREQREREQREARWKRLAPKLKSAIEAAAAAQPATLSDAAFAWLLAEMRLAKTTTREQFLLAALRHQLARVQFWWSSEEQDCVQAAKALGVDTKALIKQVEAELKAAAAPKATKAKAAPATKAISKGTRKAGKR